MTSIRVAAAVLVVLLSGCPGGEGDGDAGLDAPAPDAWMVGSCAEAQTQPSGTACAFTTRCTSTACGIGAMQCSGGRLVYEIVECFDAGPDAGPDATPDDAAACAPMMGPRYCRSEAECAPSGQTCLAPGEFGGCGTCFMPEALCATDTDCADGSVCVTYSVACSCGGDASECRPRCTDGSCTEDETCNASGRCEPTSCSAGYACAEHTECNPTGPGADVHGCERKSCTMDAECTCGGGCVDGFCYEGLGECTPPRA